MSMTARFSWNQQNTRGHRPRLQALIFSSILLEPLIDERHNLIQRLQLKSLLAGDAPDEAVYTLNVFRAAKQSARGRRRFTEAFGGLGVFLERNHIAIIGAEAVA